MEPKEEEAPQRQNMTASMEDPRAGAARVPGTTPPCSSMLYPFRQTPNMVVY